MEEGEIKMTNQNMENLPNTYNSNDNRTEAIILLIILMIILVFGVLFCCVISGVESEISDIAKQIQQYVYHYNRGCCCY